MAAFRYLSSSSAESCGSSSWPRPGDRRLTSSSGRVGVAPSCSDPVAQMTLTDSARGIAGHAVSLARLELRLAEVELRLKLRRLVRATILGAIALVIGFFALAAAVGAVAAALAAAVPVWVALLVTCACLAVIAGIAALLALGDVRRALPPVPEAAIREVRRTMEAVRSGTSDGR